MSSGNSLEAKIQRLEDLEAIRSLTNAYHAGINAHDLEAVCAGFAEDAVLVLANGVPVQGREAIRASYVAAMGKIKRVKQFIHAHSIELSGATAKATSELDARYVAVNDPNSYLVSARLLYEYVKRDEIGRAHV